MHRPRASLWLLAAVLAAVIALWLLRPASAPISDARQQHPAAPAAPKPKAARPGASAGHVAPGQIAAATETRAKRDALRASILRAQQTVTTPPQPAPAQPSSADPQRPGTLVDRTGTRAEFVRYLNHDFMPLARECIELAHEQAPELRGMLALRVETVAAEGIGAVVEKAEPAPSNEVWHPGLLECIRETALSVTIPTSIATGREGGELTLRVVPPDAGTAR